jgi:hypothetical protein
MTSSANWCPMDGPVGACGQLDPVGGAGQDKLIALPRCSGVARRTAIDRAAPPVDRGAAGVGVRRKAERR